MNIILDLDGTLVSESEDHDLDNLPTARPYLREFLEYCFTHFEHVSIWTAAAMEWYDALFEHLLQPLLGEHAFHLVYTREQCTMTRSFDPEDCYPVPINVKKLKNVWRRSRLGYTKDNTLIIDNTPSTYCRNYGNAIPIRTYRGQENDDFLLRLMRFLDQVRKVYEEQGTIRHIDKERWYAEYQ